MGVSSMSVETSDLRFEGERLTFATLSAAAMDSLIRRIASCFFGSPCSFWSCCNFDNALDGDTGAIAEVFNYSG